MERPTAERLAEIRKLPIDCLSALDVENLWDEIDALKVENTQLLSKVNPEFYLMQRDIDALKERERLAREIIQHHHDACAHFPAECPVCEKVEPWLAEK